MSQIQIGCRISCNTFKLRNLEGVVKYVGQIPGKDGSWVGVQLDQQRGDMDGTLNGEMLFECPPGHGVLLRPTQIKLLEPMVASQELGDITSGQGMEPQPQSITRGFKGSISGTLTNFLSQKLGNAAEVSETPAANTAVDSGEQTTVKAQAWKNKVEELRRKKQAEQEKNAQVAAAAAQVQQPQANEEQKEELKQLFVPSAGITRDKDGKILVNQEQAKLTTSRVQAPRDSTPIRVPPPRAPPTPDLYHNEEPSKQDKTQTNPTTASPAVEEKKKSVLASKIGGGLKPKLVGAPTGNLQAVAQQPVAQPPPAKPVLEKQASKNLKSDLEDKKDKIQKLRESRMSAKDPQPTGAKPAEASTSAGTKPIIPKLNTTTLNKEATSGANPAPSSVATKVALGSIKKVTQADPKNLATNAEDKKAPTARPMTARGSTKKEEDKQGNPVEAAPSRRVSNLTKPGTGPAASQSKLTKPGGLTALAPTLKPNPLANIPDEIEKIPEDFQDDEPLIPLSQAPQQIKTVIEYLPPTDAQLMHFMQSSGVGGVNQEELKSTLEELRTKKEEVFMLQHEVRDLSDQLTQVKLDSATELEVTKTEYEIKILELEQRLGGDSEVAAETAAQKVAQNYQMQIEQLMKQNQKQQEEHQETQRSLNNQIDVIRGKVAESDSKLAEMKYELQASQSQNNRLNSELEGKQADIEIIQLEIDALKDDKEQLLEQMRMASELNANQDDALAGLSEDELKSQNQKLRQAISALTMGFEVEKSRLGTKIDELSKRARLVDEYEKKLDDMDILLEEIEIKEYEKKLMEERLDECLEFEKMVEEMAEEILKKEDEIEELKGQIEDLEENLAVQEELNEQQEEYMKELNEEIGNKEAEMSQVALEKKQLEEMVMDGDQQNQRYRERLTEVAQQCKMLQDQLQEAYAAGDSKVKISSLIERQNLLIQKLRESSKKENEMMISRIHFWQEKMKMKVIEGFIPTRLQEHTHLDSLEKVQLLNITKQKALLLMREICEKQLANIGHLQEDQDQQIGLAKLFVAISENCISFIDICSGIHYCLSRMPIDKYQESTAKIINWTKLTLLNSFFEKVLDLIKDESLVPKFDLTVLTSTVKSLGDLYNTIQFKYVERDQDEVNDDGKMKREKELKECNKLRLRNECLRIALAVSVLGKCAQLNSYDRTEEFAGKCKLVYYRLLDIIYKIDCISGQSTGNEFLNLAELGTDNRLESKYKVISENLWIATSYNPQDRRDWTSVVEAIERDLTSLGNDPKFKKLNNLVTDETKDQQVHIDDIYTKGWDCRGPWNLIVDRIRSDLEDTEAMKDKIEALQKKVEDQARHQILLKREKDDLVNVKGNLETRLGEAQTKAEAVPQLEIEKKRLQDKDQVNQQQMDEAKRDIEKMRDREKDLMRKLEEADSRAASAMSNPNHRNSVLKKQGTQNQSQLNKDNPRNSRATTDFFKKISMSSLNKRDSIANSRQSQSASANQSSNINSAEVQKQIYLMEESYQNVIVDLQKDRLALKGQHMLQRLKKLDNGNAPMAQFISKQRERQEVLKNFSRDEQSMLEGAVDTIEGLKTKVKREMALVKVIDITKGASYQGQISEDEPSNKTIKDKINYLIVQAKDQANDALDVLFSKESNLHSVKELQQVLVAPKDSSKLSLVDPERIKIGSVRLTGLLPPLKKVINLTDSSLRDFKQNLSVFAH